MSRELHLLDSTFVIVVGQAALLSPADKSKVFFKCLNRWLPRSLEVKIKTCARGFKAQNAIYSSSLISSGILAWGLMVLEAHAHSSRNNSIMVIYNFEVANSIKAFHCVQHCTCKSWLKDPNYIRNIYRNIKLKFTESKLKTSFGLYWRLCVPFTDRGTPRCDLIHVALMQHQSFTGWGLDYPLAAVKNYLQKTNFCSFASIHHHSGF